MKIAVCLSGQPRTWRQCYDTWNFLFKDLKKNENLRETDIEVDYFIHTWDFNSKPYSVWTRERYGMQGFQAPPSDHQTSAEILDYIKTIQPKQFLIEKLEKQEGNLKNEVSYTINENKVNALKEYVKDKATIKIQYVDETASQTLTHSYFSPRFWSNESNHLCINDYLKDGLGSYLLLLTKQVEIKDDKENVVWVEKKRRLKLLSICTILNYNWTTIHQDTKKLLLLNIFHYLGKYCNDF
jgi:hypothetical protein